MVAATMEGGQAEVIPNVEGGRTTPMRFIARKWDEVIEEAKIVSYKVAKGPSDEDKEPERRPHRAPSATHREESAHDA